MTTSLYDLDRDQLAAALAGEPRYRTDQIWEGIHRAGRPLEELSNVPAAVRQRLAETHPSALEAVREVRTDGGDTTKWVWRLGDGSTIESVLMHYPDRTTVCVSSQAGCAMACGFCATGQAGFDRHLTAGEIVEQVARARWAAGDRRVSNVVFMGMGEPLANYDATLGALHRLHSDVGIGARHLTVSTVGIAPGIRRLAAAGLPVGLAVSLHAADDDLRNELVPINRRYPLADLLDACRVHTESTRRRLSFEWALINEVNDRFVDADRLALIARDLAAHVNLIPLNPTPGYGVVGSSRNRVHAFRDRLAAAGVAVTIRDTRGRDIDAACGQLRASTRAASGATVAPSSESTSRSAVDAPVVRRRVSGTEPPAP